jgi:hypothetical protein
LESFIRTLLFSKGLQFNNVIKTLGWTCCKNPKKGRSHITIAQKRIDAATCAISHMFELIMKFNNYPSKAELQRFTFVRREGRSRVG